VSSSLVYILSQRKDQQTKATNERSHREVRKHLEMNDNKNTIEQNLWDSCKDEIINIKVNIRGWQNGSGGKCLQNKCEALSSNPSFAKHK
jgi:hypothetical protein